ncbi:hypothetical protein COV17_00090 [Candidatus Woesearchaeota archaeon CG10_big_fil_rev_8_21_14_0_10_36_11]|nr:MAG: hypothetical protein COV17_00090 [Candidatus Woesearchaeota archaeon CG10_big_fil_rev_8_21_14_0_10_36_11]
MKRMLLIGIILISLLFIIGCSDVSQEDIDAEQQLLVEEGLADESAVAIAGQAYKKEPALQYLSCDEGKNGVKFVYSISGKERPPKEYTNSCKGDYAIEWSCPKSNKPSAKRNNCVANGFTCLDGMCVGQIAVEDPVCIETDGGDNIFVRGNVTGHWGCVEDGLPIVTETDSCEGLNNLREYNCNEGCNNILARDTECEFGCVNGFCLEEAIPEEEAPAELPAAFASAELQTFVTLNANVPYSIVRSYLPVTFYIQEIPNVFLYQVHFVQGTVNESASALRCESASVEYVTSFPDTRAQQKRYTTTVFNYNLFPTYLNPLGGPPGSTWQPPLISVVDKIETVTLNTPVYYFSTYLDPLNAGPMSGTYKTYTQSIDTLNPSDSRFIKMNIDYDTLTREEKSLYNYNYLPFESNKQGWYHVVIEALNENKEVLSTSKVHTFFIDSEGVPYYAQFGFLHALHEMTNGAEHNGVTQSCTSTYQLS